MHIGPRAEADTEAAEPSGGGGGGAVAEEVITGSNTDEDGVAIADDGRVSKVRLT